VVFFTAEKPGRLGVIEVQGDFVMGDGVAMLADWLEVGALLGAPKGKFPESLTTGILSF
jgi:hypothetical protein